MLEVETSPADLAQASNVLHLSQGVTTPDCLHYMQTGWCNYGVNCRFNHRRRSDHLADTTCTRSIREEYPERLGEPECQFYLKTGTCKFRLSCKFDHPKEKAGIIGRTSLNDAGFPLRLNEKDCLYYMQTGTCKFGKTCKFNHPQLENILSPLLKNCESTWSTPANPPITWLQPSRAQQITGFPIHHPGFFPVHVPSEGFLSVFSPITNQESIRAVTSNSSLEIKQQTMNAASGYGANTQNYHVPRNHYYFKYYSLTMSENSTYPERPGQPQCKYFIRTGNCKFGAYCKYDHPKRKIFASANCSINPMGFPQRPGTEPCTFDMQYGACKFGVACRFDHPYNSFTYSLSHNPIINFPVFCVPQLYGSQKSGPPAIIDARTDQQIGQDENSSNNRRPLLNVTTPEIVASGIITAKEPKSNSAN